MYHLKDEDDFNRRAIEVPILLNIAACCLKLLDADRAIECCSRILAIERGLNAKAFYRRAQALMMKECYGAAKRDLFRAIELEPRDRVIGREIGRVKELIATYGRGRYYDSRSRPQRAPTQLRRGEDWETPRSTLDARDPTKNALIKTIYDGVLRNNFTLADLKRECDAQRIEEQTAARARFGTDSTAYEIRDSDSENEDNLPDDLRGYAWPSLLLVLLSKYLFQRPS